MTLPLNANCPNLEHFLREYIFIYGLICEIKLISNGLKDFNTSGISPGFKNYIYLMLAIFYSLYMTCKCDRNIIQKISLQIRNLTD